MATTELDTKIQTAAEGPSFAADDEGSFRQQPLGDLIKTEQFLAANRATKAGKPGIRFVKLKPPGAV